MRAMVLEKPGPVEQSPLILDEVTLPLPRAGEVRVHVRCCALCHTDLHTVEGDLPLPRLPLIPGHQIVGLVDAIGEGVRTLKEGDRVGIPWLHSTDGQCDYCRRGLENLCDHAQFTGYHVDGGYAEYAVVHEDYAYPIPKIFSDQNAAPLLCAGSLVPHALRVLRKAGPLTLAGITMSPIPQMDYSLLYHERVIRSVANSTRKDCRDFLDLAAAVPLHTEVQVFELAQANHALQALKRSEITGAGVLRITN